MAGIAVLLAERYNFKSSSNANDAWTSGGATTIAFLGSQDNTPAIMQIAAGHIIQFAQSDSQAWQVLRVDSVNPYEANYANFTTTSLASSGTFTDDADVIVSALKIDSTIDYPGIEEVLDGVTFGDNGTLEGVFEAPGTENVRENVTFGANGSLTGVLTLPAVETVLLGTGYGANATELTGTLDTNGTFTSTDATRLLAIYTKLPTADYLTGTANENGSVPAASPGGSSGMLTLPPGPALASFAPITLPSASTSITALLTANNLTIPAGTIALVLQVQAESMKIDRAGGNATSNGTVIGANQPLVLSKSGNDDYSLGTPHVVRGASGATVQITCH